MKPVTTPFFSFLAVFAAWTMSQPALAQSHWTGSVSSSWNNSSNWDITPQNGTDVIIDPTLFTGVTAYPILSGNSFFAPGKVTIRNGGRLTASGFITIGDTVEINGDGSWLRILSGSVLVNDGAEGVVTCTGGGYLEVAAGNLQITQRLLFRNGGTGSVTGNVSAGEIVIENGGANEPAGLVQLGGDIVTNGDFTLKTTQGNHDPFFRQNGGTMHVFGDIAWDGDAPGWGTGYFDMAGDVYLEGGTIGNTPASTLRMHLTSTGMFYHRGTTVNCHAGDSILLNGSYWSDDYDVWWHNDGVFRATGGVEAAFFYTGDIASRFDGSGSYQFDVLHVEPGGLLDHLTASDLNIAAGASLHGNYAHHNHRLVLNGTGPQNVFRWLPVTVYDLRVINTGNAPVTFEPHLVVEHNFDLADGFVRTNDTVTIFINDNATITGGSDTTFIEGRIRKTGNEAFVFPVGIVPDRYRPLEITAPTDSATIVTVLYRDTAFAALSPVAAPLQTVSSLEYWDLSREGSADLFSVNAGWNNAGQSGFPGCDDLTLAAWDGTQWTFVPAAVAGMCTGNNPGALQSTGDLPFIGPLTAGFTTAVYQQEATICDGSVFTVDTNAYTAAGIYTDVLTGATGDDSTIVTLLSVDPLDLSVSVSVTSLHAEAEDAFYQWIDCATGNPINNAGNATLHPAANGFYAVIVTQGGCSDTSACFEIDQLALSEPALSQIAVYPNPVNTVLTIASSATLPEAPQVSTIAGTRAQLPVSAAAAGIAIDFSAAASGVYFVSGTIDGERHTWRIVHP